MNKGVIKTCQVNEHQDTKLQNPKFLDSELLQSNEIDPNHTAQVSEGPNRAEAERFLARLDPAATAFTFQTFDDHKQRKDASLASVLHGSLDEHWTRLVHLNGRGAGIFITINETDLTGRKKENITRIRALWQEADRGDEPALPIEPHLTIESSPGKYHRYILVESAPLDEVEAVQQRLVDDYGSDPNAKDISRVLRLPGFDHLKNPAMPHRVHILNDSGALPLAWAKVVEILPPVQRTVKQTSTTISAALPEPGTPLRNPADVLSALSVLNPDMNYQAWLQIGMALHSTGAGKEAYEIWDQWSKNGTLYRAGECAYRWSTFTPSGGITLGTLFHMAQAAGWNGQISTEAHILPLVERQARRMLEDFGQHHAVAMVNGQAVIVYRERDEGMERMTTRFSKPADIKLMHQPERVPSVKIVKDIQTVEYRPLVETWLNSPTRKTYRQLVFKPAPGLIAGETVLPDTKMLNLYQGLALTPMPGDCQLILDHIREVWCSGSSAAYDYVLGWLARLFQHPGERGHTVIVLRSGEGTGKNIIIDILVRAFGEHATVAVKTDDLTGRFNDHLGTSVLVFANEAVWGGSKDHEGVIKSLITDEELPIERKFLPKYRVRNCCHLIMASNNDWVAPVGLDDRRFVILDVNEARKGDSAYFQRLSDHIDNGGAEAFIDHLLKLDISAFNPRQLPDLGMNQATKRDAKIRSADTITQWWIQCLEAGEILLNGAIQSIDGTWDSVSGGSFPAVNIAKGWEDGKVKISKQTLYDAYIQWAKKSNRHIEHSSSLGKKLKELSDIRDVRPSASTDPERRRVYVLPKLRDCRAQFENKTRHAWDWGEDDDDDQDVAETLVSMPSVTAHWLAVYGAGARVH